MSKDQEKVKIRKVFENKSFNTRQNYPKFGVLGFRKLLATFLPQTL